MKGEREYRCGRGGLWLPRALAAAVLVAGVVASGTMDPEDVYASSRLYRGLVVLLGGMISLWILRDGRVVRWIIRVGPDGVEFRAGKRGTLVEYRDIVSIDYQEPFAGERHWVPALILEDRFGNRWRIPSFIDGGRGLLRELLEGAGRSELESWAEARNISRRMGRGIGNLAVWYALAGIVLLAGLLFPLVPS